MLTILRWKDQPLTIRCRRGKQSKRIASLRTITIERHCKLNRIKTEGLNKLLPRQSAHIAASAWHAMRILLFPFSSHFPFYLIISFLHWVQGISIILRHIHVPHRASNWLPAFATNNQIAQYYLPYTTSIKDCQCFKVYTTNLHLS